MPETKRREIRIDDDLWHAAKAKAHAEGDALSELVRNWLVDYIYDEPTPTKRKLAEQIIVRLLDIPLRNWMIDHDQPILTGLNRIMQLLDIPQTTNDQRRHNWKNANETTNPLDSNEIPAVLTGPLTTECLHPTVYETGPRQGQCTLCHKQTFGDTQ